MANPYRPLEVVIESAQGLENVNHFTRMKPYAVVYMWDMKNNHRSSREESSADEEGGSNPRWNFMVKFNIDIDMAEANRFALVVKLRSRRRTHGARDKDIGEVRVLIKELRDCAEGNERERRMIRSVHTFSDGSTGTEQGQGKLTFSYKFKEPTADNPTQLNFAKKKSIQQAIKKVTKLLGPVALGGMISGLTGGFVHGAL